MSYRQSSHYALEFDWKGLTFIKEWCQDHYFYRVCSDKYADLGGFGAGKYRPTVRIGEDEFNLAAACAGMRYLKNVNTRAGQEASYGT